MKNYIFNIIGFKGSGKDTVASIIRDILKSKGNNTLQIISFADSLKETAWYLYSEVIKDKNVFWGNIEDKQKELLDMGPISTILKHRHEFLRPHTFWSGRTILQFLGTEACRSIYDDVWVDKGVQKAEKELLFNYPVAFTDCRFPNEYDALNNISANAIKCINIKVVRNKCAGDGHSSESHINTFAYDYRVENNGTINDLKSNINRWVHDLP